MDTYSGSGGSELKKREQSSRRYRSMRSVIRLLTVLNTLFFLLCLILFFRAYKLQKDYKTLSEVNASLRAGGDGIIPDDPDMTQNMQGLTSDGGSQEMGPVSQPGVSSDATLATVKSFAEQGKSFLTTLKALFPTQFVVADEGRFHFRDIDISLKPCPYDEAKIVLSEDGQVVYEDEGISTSYGIDVSQHNGPVDWEAMAGSEDIPDFVYVRAGIRGYSSGKLVADEQVSANVAGARSVGAKVGVYFVTQAVNEEEAREEARWLLDLTEEFDTELPVALDVEKVESYETEPRTKNLTPEEYSRNVLAFVDEMKQHGRETIIYGNGKSFMLLMDMSMLEGVDKWFADYVAEDDYTPYFPYDFRIWQYTSMGKVAGVTGDCDMNIYFDDRGQ